MASESSLRSAIEKSKPLVKEERLDKKLMEACQKRYDDWKDKEVNTPEHVANRIREQARPPLHFSSEEDEMEEEEEQQGEEENKEDEEEDREAEEQAVSTPAKSAKKRRRRNSGRG